MKKEIITKLMEKTNLSENECIQINNILENNFIIGHNNKKKIKAAFMEKLNITLEESDDLYNKCAEVIVKGILKK